MRPDWKRLPVLTVFASGGTMEGWRILMTRLKKLLLACAIVPLSQIALQAAAGAEQGGLVLAQAGPPACQPGDPNCVPPEKVAPPQPKQPEAQPEPPAPKQEAKPERPAPEPEVRPEAPAPQPEAQPEPPAPKQDAKPERPASDPEVRPEAPAPQPEVQPEPSKPKKKAQPEVRPETPAPSQDVQPEPSAPKPEVEPGRPAAEPEARPEPVAPQPEPQPKAPVSEQKAHPERPAPKPDAQQPDRPAAPDETTAPKPDVKPAAPSAEPTAQPKLPLPAPADAPDKAAPQPVAPDGTAAPGTPPPPPAQPGDQPPSSPDVTEKQAPPPALIQKLGNPGAAAAEALDRSVGEKASNIRDVQRERRVISNEDGVRVTVEPGGRVIVQSGDEAVIRHDDRARFDRDGRDYRERRTRDGGREVLVTTRDGDEVRTIYDPNGMMIQRERRDRDGRVYVLFDNRSFGPGPADGPRWEPVVRLPPPVYDMPRDRYRVEMRSAPPRYVEEALTAPPIVEVQPQYTLDQVIYSPDLRERVRSVDLDTITFSSGAWTVEGSQVGGIEAVASGIEEALRRNPNEVFLVEGYTDAVGSVVDNLSLSDRRAEAVANVLTDHYGIPPENLVTQGYGESYLKVQTEGPERANRRVTVRRITPLLATKNGQ